MTHLSEELQTDINAIGSISVIPTILETICRRTGMGFAAVARVTDEKWIACAVHDEIHFGLSPGGELLLETTICHEIRQSGTPVIIDHVAKDTNFANHHTPALYGFQSYISVPLIRKDGTFFGTLCAIDPRPADLNNPEIINMFNLYADLISFHLNALEQVAIMESKLKEEQQTAELRDNFIAILGHDLRNPLGAIANSAQLMLRMPLDDRLKKLTGIIKDSSYRMSGLIENVLDFARGRLGDGITLNYSLNENIQRLLEQIIAELQMVYRNRIIILKTDLQQAVACDGRRVAQLFSNLLGNALTHSPDATDIYVTATSCNGIFKLSVTNIGEPIEEEVMQRIFQPFYQGTMTRKKQGLGLGLYIASEIAKAHQGTITVNNQNREICFMLTIPCNVLDSITN